MDQSIFDIRGGGGVISLENLAQETRLSNDIQNTVFLLPYTNEAITYLCIRQTLWN